jgi:Zn-dependent protease with chaperone function
MMGEGRAEALNPAKVWLSLCDARGRTMGRAAALLRFLRRWGWISAGALASPVLLVLYGTPPATDRPLPPGAFNDAARAVLAKAGIAGTPIVVRPSRDQCAWGTVSGLGPSQRIVISHGTLSYPMDEALFTIGHESGHARRGDPLLGVVSGWIWIVLGLAGAQGAAIWATSRWGARGVLAAPWLSPASTYSVCPFSISSNGTSSDGRTDLAWRSPATAQPRRG